MMILKNLDFRIRHKVFDSLVKIGITKKRPLIDKPGKIDYTFYGKEWIIRGEIHHLSGVWKSMFRFLGNHDSGKNGITFFLNPYNDVMHF